MSHYDPQGVNNQAQGGSAASINRHICFIIRYNRPNMCKYAQRNNYKHRPTTTNS